MTMWMHQLVARGSTALAGAVFLMSLGRSVGAQSLQRIDVRHAVASDVYLRFTGSVGTLRVTGWAKDSLVVTGNLPIGVQFGVSMGGDGKSPARGAKMYLEAPNDAATATGALEMRIPAGARLWVKSGTANVEARDVTGGLDINVIGGGVRVGGAPRELQIEAMDASVVIEGSPNWLRAKTASGDITLRGGSADLAMTTVSGAMRVEGGAVERGRFESVTGTIAFAGTPTLGGDITFDSHSGTIDLRLPFPGGFLLNASSITGAIENRYDNARVIPGREGRGAEVSIERGTTRSKITVRTFKGTVTVRR